MRSGTEASSVRAGEARLTGRTPQFAALPNGGVGATGSAAIVGPTIPLFTGTQTALGKSFSYRLIGAHDPQKAGANSTTTVPTVIVPIRFEFSDGFFFDPTLGGSCLPGSQPATTLTAASPIYQNHNWVTGGTSVGNTQYIDAERRAEFWKFTKPGGLNPNYHLKWARSQIGKITVSVNGNTQAAGCGRLGVVSFSSWDNFVRTTIFPQIKAQVGPNVIAQFLFVNVVLDAGGCCVLGYHSLFNNPSFGNRTQFYSNAEFDATKSFTGTADISVLSHELGEIADDPDIHNLVPAWGHIGQQSGCQTNFENGDPLSGTTIPTALGGRTWHPQDLAFYSWFYRQSPSIGVNGKYSFKPTFTSPPPVCH